jgi:hypothetical protein
MNGNRFLALTMAALITAAEALAIAKATASISLQADSGASPRVLHEAPVAHGAGSLGATAEG